MTVPHGHAESRIQRRSHVRFGMRASGTDRSRDWHRADAPPERAQGWSPTPLEQATWSRTCHGITDLSGLVCHDDARSQYASTAFTERLAAGAQSGNGRRRAWIVPWSRRRSAPQSELIRRRRLSRHFGEVERPLWSSRHSESLDSPVVAP
jgi:hypothetical protein